MKTMQRAWVRSRWAIQRRLLGIGQHEFRPRSAGARVIASAGRRGGRVEAQDVLVRDLAAFVGRYVVMAPEQLLVVALWIVHTHCIEHFDQTPYLSVTSPERRCGKSRLLEILELLVARPWMQVIPSEAVLYRHIHAKEPTLLLDEVDTIFNPRTADRYEGHRALLNAGHRRGAMVPRCVGSSQNVQEFRVFCAKVLAGIGTLPDTIADRSVPIRLKRRQRSEPVEKFRHKNVAPVAQALRERIEAWVEIQADQLANNEPVMPDELNDRMQEGCEALASVADAAGCGTEARAALVALLTAERLDDQESMRVRLLRDIRSVFEQRKRLPGIATVDLLDALYAIEESPWASYYGRSLEPRDLSSLLSHYGIGPRALRIKQQFREKYGGGEVVKGYKRDDFHDVWGRYL
jgi:hypothetical protein